MLKSNWLIGPAACLAILIGLSGCTTLAPRTPLESQADRALADRIYSELNADPLYYYRHVDVHVDGGVALLSGYIWSVDALNRAKQIAAGVPGVYSVVDQMELERNTDRGGGHSGTG